MAKSKQETKLHLSKNNLGSSLKLDVSACSLEQIRQQREECVADVSQKNPYSTPKFFNQVAKENVAALDKKKHIRIRKFKEKKRQKDVEDEFEDIQSESVKLKKRRKVDEAREQTLNLKVWDFYFKPQDHSKLKIGTNSNICIVQTLMKYLSSRQFAMFRETCFGYFLDLPIIAMQPRLIHTLLLREVVHDNRDELWLSLNGIKIRFGIGEFALITGLKCTGVAHKCYDANESCSLIDRCFPGSEKLNSQAIIDCFEGKRWSSDQDAVKIVVLYFINSFLFSSFRDSPVSIGQFELVESGEFENYPWGKLVFHDT
ncbi:uncharacterized protein LOC107791968 [Nicotiana tabacum]|uniref:Uncharacterized protein LOC107791968 n=1 Tax=Nicotiana tabacum TaxID=4097 RepID=A0A1S3ZYU8_TOBAC|nr:PREDICTED: uncharacterized protein LOC107791968 [Nicotiana tabacum]